MTTLDDKILGEKLQYYYSSSEDEGSDNEDGEGESKTIRDAVNEPEIDYSADGSAVNTGYYSTQTHPLGRRAEMRAAHHCSCVTELYTIINHLSFSCTKTRK